MSLKSKNLEFEANEPAFLRRLRGQARGDVDDDDRHINPVSRPQRPKRLDNDAEDDAPMYVVEGSNDTLTKEQYEELVDGKKNGEHHGEKLNGEDDLKEESVLASKTEAPIKSAQKVAEVGHSSKKRKALRIGDDVAEDDDGKAAPKEGQKQKSGKKRTKAKAVKLSFDDDDEHD